MLLHDSNEGAFCFFYRRRWSTYVSMLKNLNIRWWKAMKMLYSWHSSFFKEVGEKPMYTNFTYEFCPYTNPWMQHLSHSISLRFACYAPASRKKNINYGKKSVINPQQHGHSIANRSVQTAVVFHSRPPEGTAGTAHPAESPLSQRAKIFLMEKSLHYWI